MNEIDALSTQLFEEAKRFLEVAPASEIDQVAHDAFSHAALLLGFSALEAHVNAVAEELSMRPNLGVLDKSILTERDFALYEGRFELRERLKIYRFEDRLSYVFANFSKGDANPLGTNAWWGQLKEGIDLRNKLVHPKGRVDVDTASVKAALLAILECLNALYGRVYARPFPPYNRGLHSILDF